MKRPKKTPPVVVLRAALRQEILRLARELREMKGAKEHGENN